MNKPYDTWKTMKQTTTKATFFIPFTLPSLNEIVAKAKSHPMVYAKYKEGIESHIRPWIMAIPEFQRVFVTFTWCEPDRRRDPDNIVAGGMKFIFDSLVSAGKLPNDRHKNVAGFSHGFEFGKPGVRVELQEV